MSEHRVSTLRSAALAPDPLSVRHARRLVADTLTAAGRGDLVDTATLLVSEVVTNAVLHARSGIGLTITVTGDGARVEVSDHSPHLPTRRAYGAAAATGRGLELLEVLADACGADPIEGDGKTVWFTLGDRRGTDIPTDTDTGDPAAPERSPAPELVEPAAPPGQPDGRRVVRLLDVPVLLYRAWQQHADALLREFTLRCYGEERPDEGALQEVAIAHDAFARLTEQASPVFAAGAGARQDLALRLTPGEGAAFAVLRQVLEDAAALAAAGQLLAPPSQPEIAGLRRWVCTELVAQSSGAAAPRPWSDEFTEEEPPPRVATAFDTARVRAERAAVVAADDGNRILAVSPAAAGLLGWTPEELEGRRLVTIIPPRLRHAHIAAFVAHLLTGQVGILGRLVEVDALRRDGTEVPVTLLIRRLTAGDGRPVFLATLAPR